MPLGARMVRVQPCSVAFYRHLYNQIGSEYLWWMRRAESDERLAMLLNNPLINVHVLTLHERPIGIAELDYRPFEMVNLSYFGLMPDMIGRGLGLPFLQATLLEAWSHQTRTVTVNTCTADHPRALPTYLKAGFVKIRSMDEEWDIPERLGITVPERLRVK